MNGFKGEDKQYPGPLVCLFDLYTISNSKLVFAETNIDIFPRLLADHVHTLGARLRSGLISGAPTLDLVSAISLASLRTYSFGEDDDSSYVFMQSHTYLLTLTTYVCR